VPSRRAGFRRGWSRVARSGQGDRAAGGTRPPRSKRSRSTVRQGGRRFAARISNTRHGLADPFGVMRPIHPSQLGVGAVRLAKRKGPKVRRLTAGGSRIRPDLLWRRLDPEPLSYAAGARSSNDLGLASAASISSIERPFARQRAVASTQVLASTPTTMIFSMPRCWSWKVRRALMGCPPENSGSQETPRWREPDSNRWSLAERPVLTRVSKKSAEQQLDAKDEAWPTGRQRSQAVLPFTRARNLTSPQRPTVG
jgi:hypothetical protein